MPAPQAGRSAPAAEASEVAATYAPAISRVSATKTAAWCTTTLDLAARAEHGPDDDHDEQDTGQHVEHAGRGRPGQMPDEQHRREHGGPEQQDDEPRALPGLGPQQPVPERDRDQEHRELEDEQVQPVQRHPARPPAAPRPGWEAGGTARRPRCPARRPDRSPGRSTRRRPSARPTTIPIRGRQPGAGSRPSGQQHDGQQRARHQERRTPVDEPDRPGGAGPGRDLGEPAAANPLPTKNSATASISQPTASRGRADAISTPGATQTRVRSSGFHGTGSSAPAASAAPGRCRGPRRLRPPRRSGRPGHRAGRPTTCAQYEAHGRLSGRDPSGADSAPGRGRQADQSRAEPGEPDREQQVRLEHAVRRQQEVPDQEGDDQGARGRGKRPDRQAASISSSRPKNDPSRCGTSAVTITPTSPIRPSSLRVTASWTGSTVGATVPAT